MCLSAFFPCKNKLELFQKKKKLNIPSIVRGKFGFEFSYLKLTNIRE